MRAAVEAFVDFDGTISDLDTFDVLVRHFAGQAALDESERGLHEGNIPLRDVLQRQASYVRGSFAEIAAVLEREVRIDPTFPAFVERCRALAMPLTVVSSGTEQLIRLRLDPLGLADLHVIANEVIPDPAGWRIRFRDPVPNGTDKAAAVRAARDRGASTLFIGDGLSDFAAALAADRRFARRGHALEAYLHDRAIAFEPFSSFADITPKLEAAVIPIAEERAPNGQELSRPRFSERR